MVVCNMLSRVRLPQIPNWEFGLLRPTPDEISRPISRPIIDNQPLEIFKCLRLKAIEHTVQGVCPIERWRKDRYQRR
jgi:hypothetical protein